MAEARGQFGNSKGERLPVEAVTYQRTSEDIVHAITNCMQTV
jgi:hypothetical protein